MSTEALKELAFLDGDMGEVRKRLLDKGFRASLMLLGPHDNIRMVCKAGGVGVNAQHHWIATPMEALRDGCPHCKLENHIKNDPPEEVSEAVLVKAVKAQHKAISASIARSRKKQRRSGNHYGMDRYTF